MRTPRSFRVNINDLLSGFLNDDQILAHPLLIFLIHDDRQYRREKEHDNINDRQSPRCLDEIAIVRIIPQTPIARPRRDMLSGRRDIHHGGRIDRNRAALVVCDGGSGRYPRYQRPHEYHVPESDPESRVVCANRGDEDHESPDACEEGDDKEAQDSAGNGDVVLVVPTSGCQQEWLCKSDVPYQATTAAIIAHAGISVRISRSRRIVCAVLALLFDMVLRCGAVRMEGSLAVRFYTTAECRNCQLY
jgi:hypothetical protein